MTTASIPILPIEYRLAPRALVCASALVTTKGKPTTEQVVYELSTGGARLCGLSRAAVGDELSIRLQLSQESVHVRGQLLRVGATTDATTERTDLAIEFFDLSAQAEDAIHDAVVEALADPDRRSFLLLQDKRNPYGSGWDWLDPVLPICATAATPLEAVEYLEQRPCDVGIIARGDLGTPDWEWMEMYPEMYWRTLDDTGCLHPCF
jgi:hypothetical protein